MNISTRPVALAAGTLFAATAAIDIPHDQPDVFVSQLDWILEALFALALGAGAWALWSLSRQATGRVPRLAWAVAATGSSLLALTAGATHVSGRNVLGPVFGLGILLVFIGYAALAVLDLRRRFRIDLLPTFVVILDGREVARLIGPHTRRELAAGLRRSLDPRIVRVEEPPSARARWNDFTARLWGFTTG